MPATIEFTKPRELSKLTGIMKIRGVRVYVHWSVFLIVLIMLLNAGRKPVLTLAGIVSYLGVILLHETGHLIVAQRRGSYVDEIRLYPIHGRCYVQTPWSRYDAQLIAWGGVAAQAVIGVPLVLWIIFFGYTRFDAVNAVLAILGGYSLCVAAFNLLPIAGLDGSTAWGVIPEWFRRKHTKKTRPRWNG